MSVLSYNCISKVQSASLGLEVLSETSSGFKGIETLLPNLQEAPSLPEKPSSGAADVKTSLRRREIEQTSLQQFPENKKPRKEIPNTQDIYEKVESQALKNPLENISSLQESVSDDGRILTERNSDLLAEILSLLAQLGPGIQNVLGVLLGGQHF